MDPTGRGPRSRAAEGRRAATGAKRRPLTAGAGGYARGAPQSPERQLLRHAVGVEDARHRPHVLEHRVEVHGVGHLEGEAGLGDAVAGGGEVGAEDVHVGVGERHRDVGEQPGPVEGLDLDVDEERRLRGGGPLDLEQLLRLGAELGGVGAVVAVHRDAAALGDEAEDPVGGHRRAALRELHPHIGGALHDDAGLGAAGDPWPAAASGERDGLGQVLLDAVLATEQLDDLAHHRGGAEVALADGGVEGRDVGDPEAGGDLGERVVGEQPLDRQALLAHELGDLVLAPLDRLLAALLGEPLPDLGARPRRPHEAEPVARRAGVGVLGREHLDDVAVVERGLQRHQPAVHPGADGVVADLGVDGVGEVDRGGTGGQRDHVAARREDVDLGAVDLEAQRLQELAGVVDLALPVEQLAHPGHVALGRHGVAALVGVAARARVVLVLPVRRDAVLGAAVHREGADLHLDRLARRAHHRRVQRLVHVELRHRDVVLESPQHRVPAGVKDAEHRVAVAVLLDQDADADQVVDVVELAAADDHLLVDRVVVLRPAGDRGGDLRLAQVLLDLGDHLGEELVARRRPLGHHSHDLVVDLRVQGGEREVLQLPLDGVHAEPVGQRGVDVEGLAGGALLAAERHVPQRAHVVQPVGELDDEHPDVARHRDDHLADGLRLRGVAVLDLVELGDAVDHLRHLLAELLAAPFEGVGRVLDGVVQQRGDERGLGHADAGEDRGDGERVGDVPVAALAHLGAVHGLGGEVGPLEQRQVGLGMVRAHRAEQRLQHRVGGLAARAHPGQPGAHAAAGGGDVRNGPVRRRASGLGRTLRRCRLRAVLRHVNSLGADRGAVRPSRST